MELSGPWRAIVADDDLRRSAVGLHTDDSGWTPIDVPGHWRSTPSFADNDDPLLYRTSFSHRPPADGERAWVILDGVFYQADVWLDGAYLGDPEGYFVPHAFDVTDLARLGDDHVLAVEVACAPQRNRTAKRNLTGVFQHHEFGGAEWNPGGIWRPVRVETTGMVRIDGLRVLCRDAAEERAHLRLHARLDSNGPLRIELRTLVDGQPVAQREYSLATGLNNLDWDVDVAEPRLWWPWGLGDQQLTTVDVEVYVGDQLSHRRSVRTGLRQVAMDHWRFSVNGEQLFLLGVNLAPTQLDVGNATAQSIRHDLHLAREAGLNLVRVQGHVGHPQLYAAADELGLLVWQDMPLQWGYHRSVRKQAVRQAEELVNLLGHHPSIIMWSGHNEPLELRDTRALALRGGITHHMLREQRPSWNELLLDPWIKRAFERADETRPAIAHSDHVPRPPIFEGGDTHLFFGWYHGDERDLSGFAAAVPRMVRFVSDFGAPAAAHVGQAVTGRADRDDLAPFADHLPIDRYARPEAWVAATQQHQAELLRTQIETLRRLKYRPTGGFAFSNLFDPIDEIGFGILDVQRHPKQAYQAVTDACRRVIVVADPPAATLHPGSMFAVDVHVVNDERTELCSAQCTATLRWPGGRHDWSFTGSVAADDVARIATLQVVVPNAIGEVWLDLALEYRNDDDTVTGVASNRYVSQIVAVD